MPTRRTFIRLGALAGIGAIAAGGEASYMTYTILAAPSVQTPMPGNKITKFVDPLPTFVGKRVQASSLTVQMQEYQQMLLPESVYQGLDTKFKSGTYVWGYKVGNKPVSTPGYTVEAQQGTPTSITYINKLPIPSASNLQAQLTIDQTIHWAAPSNQMGSTKPYQGTIPTVTHLHGAEVSSASDGTPEQWFTSDGLHGKGYATTAATTTNASIYKYPNGQPASTLWFHDHSLGMTRINVFSGLAGFYLLRDKYDTGLPDNPLKLPAGQQEIELAIQDRQFDINGQLLFPNGTPEKTPTGLNGPPPNTLIHPYWIPEFFGDVVMVNGKTWPYLDVEPRRYRFRIVNGSNARFYRMHLVDAANSKTAGPAFWQIGSDGGLMDVPVQLNDPNKPSSLKLFLAPGERADIIIDFSNHTGRTFTLMNDAPAPYPDGDAPEASTTANIMQFRVKLPLSSKDTTYDPGSGIPLRGGTNQPTSLVRLADPTTGNLGAGVTITTKRQLVLVEVEGPGGPIEVLLNNTKWRGIKEGTIEPVAGSQADKLGQGIYITEMPRVGTTEEWEIINLTEDAHPIHIHLIQFQLLNRQKFDTDKYRAHYDSLFPGGSHSGVTPKNTWDTIAYKKGVYIPGFGPPFPYLTPNAAGAIGGNPDVAAYLQGAKILADVNEVGWKDTLKMYPGEVTRIVARWAPIATPLDAVQPGQNLYPFDPTTGPGYVWHCHILDHEDNEMMRPYAPVM